MSTLTILTSLRNRFGASGKSLAAVIVASFVVAGLVRGFEPGSAARIPTSVEVDKDEGDRAGETKKAQAERMREGERLVDRVGYFKVTGDRLTFYADNGAERYGGLENLALERIARVIGETPGTLEWTISGVVTEFRGGNYLLVTHAVLKNKGAGATEGR
jgi:hypothetical protein